MGGPIVDEVMEYAPEDLTLGQMAVLNALASDARESGPYERIAKYKSGLPDIVRRARVTEGTAKNALGVLVRRGLITPLLKGQIGTTQHYRVTELGPHHRTATASAPVTPEQESA